MSYTREEVDAATGAYAARPRMPKRPTREPPPDGPLRFGAVRNLELVLEPHLTAPMRGIQLYALQDPPNQAFLADLLPILHDVITGKRTPTATPTPPAARLDGNYDEMLNRLADPGRSDSDLWPEIQGWIHRAAYVIEAYAGGEPSTIEIALEDPLLDEVRPKLVAALAADLRLRTREALLKLLADGQPG